MLLPEINSILSFPVGTSKTRAVSDILGLVIKRLDSSDAFPTGVLDLMPLHLNGYVHPMTFQLARGLLVFRIKPTKK